MTNLRQKIRPAVVAFVILGVGTGLAFVKAEENTSATHSLTAASAQTRVKTVEQRCRLTNLMIHGVVFKPGYKEKVENNYKKCLAQLIEVKKIAKESE